MAPNQAVLNVKELAEETFDEYPIVTTSNRWIRVELMGSWENLGQFKTALRQRGYQVNDHTGSRRARLKITKSGLHWPHQE